MRVFISHAPEDAGIAHRLYNDLKRMPNIRPWMADIDLLPGQNRKREINRAIRDSRFFIPILSSRSVGKAGYVHKEIRLALETLDEMPDGEIFVIPVRTDDCEPAHDRLEDIRPADLFPDYGAGLARIRGSLGAGAEGDAASETKGTMPMNSRSEQIRRLADALMECPAMRNGRTREQIVDCLPPDVSRHIDPSGPVGTVVPEMVDRCLNYRGGIDRLMECVGYHERDSIPFGEAERVREEIFGGPESRVSTPPEPREPLAESAPPSMEQEPGLETKPDQPLAKTEEKGPSGPSAEEPPGQNAPWEKVAAYSFGVVFVVVMLVFAVVIPEPKPFQQWIFRVVLSLAAAGVGAVVPGLINVEMKKPAIRAAGAFALFVIVYLLNPPAL